MEMQDKLTHILTFCDENEVVEFKEAKSGFDFTKMGKYFSALANEANLKQRDSAWLIFGVDNAKNVVGTNYRNNDRPLDSIKKEIADKTTGRITFKEIHTVHQKEGRVLLFEIPPAPRGIPIAFAGHYYGRDGESLIPLNIEEIERIRNQSKQNDWSVEIVNEAGIDDLDENAILQARKNFKVKFPNLAGEVDTWDDSTFLNKAKITIKGKITRAALLLLGKSEAEPLLGADPKIRWILKNQEGVERDYDIFGPPLLMAVDAVYAKIRNIKYRYMQPGTLFPEEVDKYDPYSIREALHNCIAHQDYTLVGRINVIESEDSLQFTNVGSFIPSSVQQVVTDDSPTEYYRNPFLAHAMVQLNMVDTIGSGIKKMFIAQRKRFFPLPKYDLSNNRVSVTLIGKVLDMDYANLLARNSSLNLWEIILLDKVQKKLPLLQDEIRHLRAKRLIEGRKPHFYIAKNVAQNAGEKASYTKNKAFNDKYYCDLIQRALTQHRTMTRKDVDELLGDKLPAWMSYVQKRNKIGNLLTKMRQSQLIVNKGSLSKPLWQAALTPLL